MSTAADITIVGAGPYGLSVGAHLAHIGGPDVRIIGQPMHAWAHHMPRGMQLKSAGFASNLADLQGRLSLRAYCEEAGVPYDDFNVPIPVDVFAAYGLAFQKRFLPRLDTRRVIALRRDDRGFSLELDDGDRLFSRKVILATGQDDFAFMPPVLGHLPSGLVTHANRHHVLEGFRDQETAVVGSGASAIDLGVLLHEAGARVCQIMRRPQPEFSTIWRTPSDSRWSRLRRPVSGIGPGWRSRLCVDLPGVFRWLPDATRLRIVAHHLGPSSGWFMKERAAVLRILGGQQIRKASVVGNRVRLQLEGAQGVHEVQADHVIAATGYRIDLSRIAFLDTDLRTQIRLAGQYPRLHGNFESSVAGLFFVGPIAAGSFGPVMRFVVGAGFTARQLAAYFSRSRQTSRLGHRAQTPA